jgi:signal peptide peptidase SppA
MMKHNKLWLIEPNCYSERTLVEADFPEQMAIFTERQTEAPLYEIRDGTAVISMTGTLSNTPDFFSFLFGDAVLPGILAQIRAADNDPDITGIVLRIDSPGGPPDGLAEFARAVKGLSKPIVGFCDGMVASGAYWIASALDSTIISSTSQAGSIGVIAVLMEFSKMAEMEGVTPTVIRAGKYKAVGNRFEPLTAEGEETIQAEIDFLYSVFIDAVADNKGLSVEEVLKMADGKVYIGQQAVDIGLVDKIGFLDDAIEAASSSNIINGGTVMKTVAELRTEYPELCAEIEAAVEMPDVSLEVSAETDRITGLAVAHFGEDIGKKFNELVKLGVSVEQYTSMRGLMPVAETDADLRVKHLAALEALKTEDPGTTGGKTDGPQTYEAAWKAIKAEKGCSTQQAMSRAAKEFPELHEAQKIGGAK